MVPVFHALSKACYTGYEQVEAAIWVRQDQPGLCILSRIWYGRLGLHARTPHGDILFAAAGPLSNLSALLQAESNAILKAIDLSENFGMGKVIFETDCLNLKQVVCSDASDRAALGALFREAKYRLRLGFIEYRMEFSPRNCNTPAHVLASLGSREVQSDHTLWITNFPADVTHAAAGDLAATTC